MSYSIIRMQKMKATDIKGIQFHNQRERESETNPDIDKAKLNLNYDLINIGSINYNETIQKTIDENVTSERKIRKDAVRLTEFLITSDKPFFEELTEEDEKSYFKTSFDFLADRYGEKNLIYATVHRDEKTPHMHVGFVPITEDGRLSAKDFFGQRLELVKLQDDFNAHLKDHGFDLERGVSSSRKHVETSKLKAVGLEEKAMAASQALEQKINDLKRISDNTKQIDNIPDPKKAFGQVVMKVEDYESLRNHAIDGAITKHQNEGLKADLQKIREENAELKSELQSSQDRVRLQYKAIEKENENLKENLDNVVETKVEERITGINTNFQREYDKVVEAHNDLLNRSKKALKIQDDEIKQLKIERDTFKLENRSYIRENSGLKHMIESQKEEISTLKKQLELVNKLVFQALKEHMSKVLTWLMIQNVDQGLIKELSQRREKFIESAVEDGTKEIHREEKGEVEQEIER